MSRTKICVVTGSRADYGLLYWLMRDLQADESFDLQVVVTGMHLSPEFGSTVKLIETDNFPIAARIETLLSSDSAIGVTKAVGLGVISFAEVFDRLRPNLVVLLGDRFEIFAAAQAAMFALLPIGHVGGGDVTEGAFDDAMRHGISKMSHLHFVTNQEAAKRLARMGERPDRIFNVGSPGLDYLHRASLLDRATLEKELDFKFRKRNFLVTFHPVTLDPEPSGKQLAELLDALDEFDPDHGLIFTMPNADTEGRLLIRQIEEFVARKENARAFVSLGQKRYLSTLAAVDVVIGNSSSGIYEAPSLRTPTVNIGNRQKGRLRAASVVDCLPQRQSIIDAVGKALAFGRQPVVNPYQLGDSAQLTVAAIRSVANLEELPLKRFFDGTESC